MLKNIFLCAFAIILLESCGNQTIKNKTNEVAEKKIGVLLVNHGSRSDAWRNALLDLEKNVRDSIMKDGTVAEVKTAFMEYTEPSIATRLKQFDSAQYSDVIIVPIFLTVSSHSFDDIPTLIGQKDDPKSIELFKIEKMERYKPTAKIHIAPLLDFSDILKKNVLSRYKELSKDPDNEGLVLMAYGDQTYNTEWSNLMEDVAGYVKENAGTAAYSYNWCGHIAHYSSDSTTVAVHKVLQTKEHAVVIPVLVAFDEMFQVKIIGGGLQKIANNKTRISYRPDAILPDKNVERWVIETSKQFTQQISETALNN